MPNVPHGFRFPFYLISAPQEHWDFKVNRYRVVDLDWYGAKFLRKQELETIFPMKALSIWISACNTDTLREYKSKLRFEAMYVHKRVFSCIGISGHVKYNPVYNTLCALRKLCEGD